MINKFGLYKTTVPRAEIPIIHSSELDHQSDGWWRPMFAKDGIYIVDTYHIDQINGDALQKIIADAETEKDNTWPVCRADSEFYYTGTVKAADKNKDGSYTERSSAMIYFKEVCDLRDYTITDKDPDMYHPEDVIHHVMLFREHGYPSGVTLLRKGAEPDPNRTAEVLCRQAIKESERNGWYSLAPLHDLLRMKAGELSPESVKLIQLTLETCRKINQLHDRIRDIDQQYWIETQKLMKEDEDSKSHSE